MWFDMEYFYEWSIVMNDPRDWTCDFVLVCEETVTEYHTKVPFAHNPQFPISTLRSDIPTFWSPFG